MRPVMQFGEIELSVRTTNVLGSAKIFTVEQLSELTEREAKLLPHCGPRTVGEFKAVLAANGLSFRRQVSAAEAMRPYVDLQSLPRNAQVPQVMDEAKQKLVARLEELWKLAHLA